MGFMAGFAEGFANTFNAMENRRQSAKSDMFKISYDAFIRNKAKYEEDEKADKERIQAAKAAVLAAGPNVPTSAWEHAYQLLAGGMSMENTVKQLGKYQFGTNSTPAMGEDPFTPQTAPGIVNASVPGMGGAFDARNPQGFETAQPMTDDGTMAAGLETAQPPVEPVQVAQSDPTQITGLFGQGGLLDPESVKARQMQGASNDVMKAAGIDQATFDKYNQGYQSPVGQGTGPSGLSITGVSADDESGLVGGLISEPDPSKAMVTRIGGKSQNVFVQGGVVYDAAGRPLPKEQQAEAISNLQTSTSYGQRLSTFDDVQNATKDIAVQKATTNSVLADLQELTDMVQANPTTITRVSGVSTFVNEAMNELNGLMAQADALGNIEPKQLEQMEKEAMNKLNALTGNMARDQQLVANKIVAMKFKVARILNGSGTLAQRDVDDALQTFTGTNDPRVFLDSARQLGATLVEGFNNQVDALAQTGIAAKAAETQVPLGDIMNPIANDWVNGEQSNMGGDMAPAQENIPADEWNKKKGSLKNFRANDVQAKALGIGKGERLFQDGKNIYDSNGKLIAVLP